MRLLYQLLFPVFFLLSAPFYFLKMWRRGGWRAGFGQRFGFYSPGLLARLADSQRVIWVHAVSVGEVNLCVPLLQELAKRMPDVRWVVSTTTSTGMGELTRKLPDEIVKLYYPVDLKGAVNRAWQAIRPQAVVLVEAEIWPNFLWRAAAGGIPVVLVNARMSDRSLVGYRRFSFFFKNIFQSLAGVAAQSESDLNRWTELGCRPDRAVIPGNMKFDLHDPADTPQLDVAALLATAGIPTKGPVIVAGSTHAGEERVLAQIFLGLAEEFPDLLLILVPRHMERAPKVERELQQLGINCLRRTKLPNPPPATADGTRCLIVDTTGELRDFYHVADVVFVGKSLLGKGGQNPIEPAAMGKAIIVGPNMQNFRDAVRLLKAGEGLLQVSDSAELEMTVRDLIRHPERRERLGRCAAAVVGTNRGSVAKTAAFTMSCLSTGTRAAA